MTSRNSEKNTSGRGRREEKRGGREEGAEKREWRARK